VCEPAEARLAAAEAFARFRAAVASADDPSGLDPETLLMSATRHAAAALARTSTRPTGVRALLGRDQDRTMCAAIPGLLAARADGILDPTELNGLAVHLEQDSGCRQIAAAFERAEDAYRHPGHDAVDADVEHDLLVALAGAAPLVAPGSGWLEELLEDARDEAAAAEPEPEPPAAAAAPLPEPPAPAAALPEPPSETPTLTAPTADVAARPSGLPRTRRRVHLPHPHGLHLADHGPVYRFVLPAAAVIVAVIIILAIAGVFGGDGPAPAAGTPSTAIFHLLDR
jgi:hypothetical protein